MRSTSLLAKSILAMMVVLAATLMGAPTYHAQEQAVARGQENQVVDNGSVVADQTENSLRVAGKRIDSLIASQARGGVIREMVRVFSGGVLIDSPAPVTGLVRKSGRYYPDSRILVVTGDLNGSKVIEDIHFLEADDSTIVLRDIYLDGETADLSVGRGLPFRIDSGKNESEGMSALAVAAPTVSSISGYTDCAGVGIVNGKVAMNCDGSGCGTTYDGNYAINDQPGKFTLTLNGNNFGTSRGSVVLAGNYVPILSWANTRIVIDPTVPWYSSPLCALLKITTASGGVLNSGINIVPAIRTRIYGQCTFHVALTRLQMGMQPSPSAYGGYTSIDGRYVPRAGDQYQWATNTGKHTAIVVSVSGPVSAAGGIKTWTLTVSQQNADCRNSINRYPTSFQTKTVNGVTSVAAYPKSSWGASCTLYYPPQ